MERKMMFKNLPKRNNLPLNQQHKLRALISSKRANLFQVLVQVRVLEQILTQIQSKALEEQQALK